MKYCSLIFVTVCLLASCKHNHSHELSGELKQAFEIQQSAIALNDSLSLLLKAIPDSISLQEITNQKEDWLSNMVEIPGAAHDHSGCSHDHKTIDYALSDQEMIEVQKEWRDSIYSLEKRIKSLIQ